MLSSATSGRRQRKQADGQTNKQTNEPAGQRGGAARPEVAAARGRGSRSARREWPARKLQQWRRRRRRRPTREAQASWLGRRFGRSSRALAAHANGARRAGRAKQQQVFSSINKLAVIIMPLFWH